MATIKKGERAQYTVQDVLDSLYARVYNFKTLDDVRDADLLRQSLPRETLNTVVRWKPKEHLDERSSIVEDLIEAIESLQSPDSESFKIISAQTTDGKGNIITRMAVTVENTGDVMRLGVAIHNHGFNLFSEVEHGGVPLALASAFFHSA